MSVTTKDDRGLPGPFIPTGSSTPDNRVPTSLADRWVAREIELGPGAVDAAAANLKRVVEAIDTQTVG